jgi:hypothetical protein
MSFADPLNQLKDNCTVDEKLGIVTLEQVYDAPDLITAVTFVPNPAPVSVPIIRRHPVQRPDGRYDVTLIYDGHMDPTNAEGEDFKIDRSYAEEPIESHPQIIKLAYLYQGQEDNGRVVFPMMYNDTIPGLPADFKNPLFGTSSYINPGVVWTWTFAVAKLPDNYVRRIGTIDTPQVGRKGQAPPAVYDGRNWLCIGGVADWRGNIWKATLSWKMSGPGGWNQDIYGAGNTGP